jgi:8-oxo-dGTP pyrophosphatase MutT (NUDIX family)
MLDELLRRVSNHTPRTLETDRRFPEAAVLVPITRSDEPELVLTLRASGLSTHGGEVAFPGGRRDPEDPDLIFTALREAEEEIGLPPGLVEVIGPLSPLISLHGIKVTPYVGLIPDFVEYRPTMPRLPPYSACRWSSSARTRATTPTVSITRAAAGTCPAIAMANTRSGADGDHDRRVDQPAL